jgi:hypothetical protein
MPRDQEWPIRLPARIGATRPAWYSVASGDRIARAFWGLLLSEGADRLTGFSAAGIGFDTGDDYTEIEVGYSRGEFYAMDMHDPLADEDA